MTTPFLEVAEMQPSQSQPHTIFNAGARRLEAAINISITATQNSPPASPPANGRYIVGASPTGAWVGHSDDIAFVMGGAWQFLVPQEGWIAWLQTSSAFWHYTGAAWAAFPASAVAAADVAYDNSTSGLTASDVQAAIDEIVGLSAGSNGQDGFYGDGKYVFSDHLFNPNVHFDYYSSSGGVSQLGISARPGVSRVGTGTTTTGYAGFLYSGDASAAYEGLFLIGGGALTFEAAFRLPDLPDGTESYYARLGFMDELSGAPGTGVHVQIEWSGSEVLYRLANRGAGSTFTNGSSVPSANTWHTCKIKTYGTGTDAELYLDDALVAQSLTNLPTNGFTFGYGIQKSAGTTARSLDVDWITITWEPT
jgi:hypothetical protein